MVLTKTELIAGFQPTLVELAAAGAFDRAVWTTATAGAASLNVDQAMSAIL
jgi:hypothetical protein